MAEAPSDGVKGLTMDPFLSAFREPELMERLARIADVRQHMADPGFIKQIEKLRDLAADPKLDCNDLQQTSAVSQQIAKAGHYDPRVMQALMALQGQGLSVDEKDLKRAEEFGDMPRREPVQLEHKVMVKDIQDADVAKSKGNEYFKAGDFNAALAHYERGVELLRHREEVPASVMATLLSNMAMAYLKLKWPDRAKKHASKAIAVVRHAEDESFDQSKLFYRRALACEQLKDLATAVEDMSRALQQAKKSCLSLAEQHRLKSEIDRLRKLKSSHETQQQKKIQERENEREAEVARMQGTALSTEGAAAKSGIADPGGGSYLQERDFSHWATQKVRDAVKTISYKCSSGGRVHVVELQDHSKIQASIATKRGNRSLYYEMDLHLLWKGIASPKLKPEDGDGEMQGLIRVYNIAHDTNFELGGDENTSYMYQLGWDHRLSGPWVDDLKSEAAELFDCVAAKVDMVIEEMRKK